MFRKDIYNKNSWYFQKKIKLLNQKNSGDLTQMLNISIFQVVYNHLQNLILVYITIVNNILISIGNNIK